LGSTGGGFGRRLTHACLPADKVTSRSDELDAHCARHESNDSYDIYEFTQPLHT